VPVAVHERDSCHNGLNDIAGDRSFRGDNPLFSSVASSKLNRLIGPLRVYQYKNGELLLSRHQSQPEHSNIFSYPSPTKSFAKYQNVYSSHHPPWNSSSYKHPHDHRHSAPYKHDHPIHRHHLRRPIPPCRRRLRPTSRRLLQLGRQP
jgi:hypothetical protein